MPAARSGLSVWGFLFSLGAMVAWFVVKRVSRFGRRKGEREREAPGNGCISGSGWFELGRVSGVCLKGGYVTAFSRALLRHQRWARKCCFKGKIVLRCCKGGSVLLCYSQFVITV